jgi:AraC-like DNA-binding protein
VEPERLIEAWIEEMIASRPPERFFYAKAERAHEPVEAVPAGRWQHVSFQHELAFVTSGRACVDSTRQDFVLSPGDLLLIEPGVDHTERPAEAATPYAMCWCALDRSYALISHTGNSPSENWHSSAQVELHGRTDVQSLGVAMGAELSRHPWGWERAVGALLEYLGCILIRRIRRGQSMHLAPSEAPAIAHDPSRWGVVQRALQYCRDNYSRPLRVADVAQAVGYSSSRLSHLFSSYLGESLADHVRRLRLAQARDLLEYTDYTIADIARRIGYGDPAHFTRAFVRVYEHSPNAYRRQLRGQ